METAEAARPQADAAKNAAAKNADAAPELKAPELVCPRGGRAQTRGDPPGMPSTYLEGANSLTLPVKKTARGFRNVGYLATTIFPGLGRLSFEVADRKSVV